MPELFNASVKVMRSHDYCHFEVSLSTTEATSLADVDNLRKEAARLADKAVQQYQVARKVQGLVGDAEFKMCLIKGEAENIEQIPEAERTPGQQAVLKNYKDACHAASLSYDYEDDFNYPDYDED